MISGHLIIIFAIGIWRVEGIIGLGLDPNTYTHIRENKPQTIPEGIQEQQQKQTVTDAQLSPFLLPPVPLSNDSPLLYQMLSDQKNNGEDLDTAATFIIGPPSGNGRFFGPGIIFPGLFPYRPSYYYNRRPHHYYYRHRPREAKHVDRDYERAKQFAQIGAISAFASGRTRG